MKSLGLTSVALAFSLTAFAAEARNATTDLPQSSAPGVPGTSNEGKADPASQSNPNPGPNPSYQSAPDKATTPADSSMRNAPASTEAPADPGRNPADRRAPAEIVAPSIDQPSK